MELVGLLIPAFAGMTEFEMDPMATEKGRQTEVCRPFLCVAS
jgi:hypothetical protein